MISKASRTLLIAQSIPKPSSTLRKWGSFVAARKREGSQLGSILRLLAVLEVFRKETRERKIEEKKDFLGTERLCLISIFRRPRFSPLRRKMETRGRYTEKKIPGEQIGKTV